MSEDRGARRPRGRKPRLILFVPCFFEAVFGVVDLALKGRLFFAHRPQCGGGVILEGDNAG